MLNVSCFIVLLRLLRRQRSRLRRLPTTSVRHHHGLSIPSQPCSLQLSTYCVASPSKW